MNTYHVPRTTYQVGASNRLPRETWYHRARCTRQLVRFLVLGTGYLVPSVHAQQLQLSELPAATSTRTISPRFEHLDLEDGLSQGQILSMYQDRQGFMWMGTQDGLNRYDGHEFKIFRNQPFDSTTMNPGWIWDIDEDDRGNLWVVTWGAGANVLDPVTETFVHFTHSADDSTTIPGDNARSLMTSRDGTVWIGTNVGLASTPAETPGVFTRYLHSEDDSTTLSHSDVHVMFEDASGILWFGTHNGLNRLDPSEPGKFVRHLMAEEFEEGWRADSPFTDDHQFWAIFERPEEEGILWLGTNHGLIRFDTESGSFSRYVPNPDDWRLNSAFGISQDPTNPGVLWLSAAGTGLARFDIRTRTFVIYTNDPNDPHSLTENNVGRVITDRSGMVWVGMQNHGVERFNPSSIGFAHIRHAPNVDQSLPGTVVWAIHQTRDGDLWVSSQSPSEPTLTRMNRATGEYEHFVHNDDVPRSFMGGGINDFHEDVNGDLWLTGRRLQRLDRRTGRFETFEYDESDSTSISGNGSRELYGDQLGNLWVATWNGLNRMGPDRSGRFTRFLHNEDPDNFKPESSIRAVAENLAGFIWAGTNAGLVRLDPESGKSVRYTHDPLDKSSMSNEGVYDLLERAREPGVLWIATGGGLNRFDVANGTFRHFAERQGLSNNIVYTVLEDEDGRLWMSTNNGLSRFDPETETFRNYGLEIGLQGLEFNQWSAFRASTGEMFFGGTNGLNAFFPNELSENLNPPSVALVDLKLFNTSIRESGEVKLERPLAETDEILLDYTQQDVSFDYVALHFADPGNNEFAYMLDGYDEDWIYVGESRTATFTNLEPGNYTFRVKAANSDGVWNEEGASIRLVITPPFWETWWFRLLGFLMVGGVIFGGYQIRTAQLASRARVLEGQVNERTGELKASNLQLEQSATIVEAINQETNFRRLLTKILEEARVIPGVEKATALVYMQEDDRFHVRASSGWDVEAMQDIKLTRAEARKRYVKQAEEVSEDIFVAKNVAEREGADLLAEFGRVASFLVLRVRVEDEVVGYLVFDNLNNPNAFEQRDVDLLDRLREHIHSAFIKTRILEELQMTLSNLRSTQDRLVQSEKMASLGQLTAGIAHEIKNPLNFVNNFSEVTTEIASELASEIASLKDVVPAGKAEELESMLESLILNARKIAEHGKRADGIVQNMLEHSKSGEGPLAPTDINGLLDEYMTLAHHGFRAQSGDFEVHVERNLDDSIGQVDIIPQEMGRVFMNLIGNAFDALRENGERRRENGGVPMITISTARSGPNIEIRVSDNGPGIPDKVKARIFEPFFTTKPTGSGTGLGLSMSYDIVTKGHGGSLEVESTEGGGATFVVKLPA